MVSDGIDRLRGQGMSDIQYLPTPGRDYRARPSSMTGGMSTLSADADSASTAAQRYGVIVHGIYATGVGRAGRNSWEVQLGQGGVAKISEESGGEYFSLGGQNLVSFTPYLDRIQKVLNNQYYLVFQATPKKKSGLQRVGISTSLEDVEIAAADNVWVPVPGDANDDKK
jgi:hypothetical protein